MAISTNWGAYPIVVVLTAAYIDKKVNHIDFWQLNNKIYGKFLTYIITLFFLIFFILLDTAVVAGFSNVMYVTIINFIPRYLVVIAIMFLTIYTAISGLTVVGRVSELFSYSMVTFIALLLFFIPRGSIDNVKPLIPNVKDIIKAVPPSLFSYTGVEISYLTISFITNKRNTKKAGIIAAFTIIFIYVLSVFITVYVLGWELTSKITYPLLYLVTTVHLSVIENFTSVIMVLWSAIIFKTIGCELFASSYCLSKILNKGYKKCCIYCSVLIGTLSYFYIPEYNRVKILDVIEPYMASWGILWGVVTSVVVLLKTRKNKDSCNKTKG